MAYPLNKCTSSDEELVWALRRIGGLQESHDIIVIRQYHWCLLKTHFAAIQFSRRGAVKVHQPISKQCGPR
jgi:hypothetical protein